MVSFPKISPNLLLGVGGIIAVVFLVNQIRKAGADLANFGENLKLPELPSLPAINLPSINIGGTTVGGDTIESKFPDIPQNDAAILELVRQQGLAGQTNSQIIDLLSRLTPLGTPENPADRPTTPTPIDVVLNAPDLTDQQKKDLLGILSPVNPNDPNLDPNRFNPPEGKPQFTGREEDRPTVEAIPTTEIMTPEGGILPKDRPTSLLDVVSNFFKPQTAPAQPQPQSIQQQQVRVQSSLPDNQKQFQGFAVDPNTQFFVRENPIDTLQEAIELGLTASQARDFLESSGGRVTPSQIQQGLVNPDVRNIVGGISGGGMNQNIPVSQGISETLSIREQENIRAAKFTCENFGLNCELAGMA